AFFLRSLHLGLAFPSILYLATLTVFLFRPPDLDFYHADRIAFVVLVFLVALRALAFRERIPFLPGIVLPMMVLIILAVFRALREPFNPELWGLVATKFIVPLVLFHVALLVFRREEHRRQLGMFVLLALGYLSFTAIAFLLDARSLIFPRYILDSG